MMERREVLPAWAVSMTEVSLHHHHDLPKRFCESGDTPCLSPRPAAGWAGGVAGAMLVSLKDVVDADAWSMRFEPHGSPQPSPTPSSAISTASSPASSRSSSFTSEPDVSGLVSADDTPREKRKSKESSKTKKRGGSHRERSERALKAKNTVVYRKEDGKRCLQAGTFERVVQWVITKEVYPVEQVISNDGNPTLSPRSLEPDIGMSGVGRAFLAAYRQHASAERLLCLVDEYYRNPPKRGKRTPQEQQTNCVYFVGAWVEEGFTRDFYRCVHKPALEQPANSRSLKQLLAVLAHMSETHLTEVNRIKLSMLRRATEAPGPGSLPAKEEKKKGSGLMGAAGRLDILTWDIAELAEQMTLMESAMFLAMRPSEFHKLAWRNNDSRKKSSPHIVAAVERFNTVSYWVSSSIVTCNDLKKRVAMVKQFVKLAEECLKLRNFSTLMAVLAGLNNSAVQRLKLTWAGVKESTKQTLEALGELMESKSNYKHYRDLLLKEEFTNAPVVPYLGLYLRDLTFIDEGNANSMGELINFEKLVMQGEVILQIAKWQRNGSYDLEPHRERQLSLSKLLILPEDILYKKSEAIEPSSLHTQL